MAEKINLRSSKVKEQKRRVADYGTETPLSSTAVERGTTRWLNGSRVDIDGILNVTGTTTISGALNVSGTTTLSGSTTIAGPTGITGALTIAGSMSVTGPSTFAGTLGINGATTITGELDVTGPTTLAGTLGITGDTTIAGLLDIEGDTTLTGDMDVLGGGKITVGNTILSPSAANGGVEFASGGGVGGNGGGVVMRGSANAGFMALADTTSAMFAGASQITASNVDVKIASPLINLNAPQTSVNGDLVVTGVARFAGNNVYLPTSLSVTTQRPNLYIDGNGRVFKSSWVP